MIAISGLYGECIRIFNLSSLDFCRVAKDCCDLTLSWWRSTPFLFTSSGQFFTMPYCNLVRRGPTQSSFQAIVTHKETINIISTSSRHISVSLSFATDRDANFSFIHYFHIYQFFIAQLDRCTCSLVSLRFCRVLRIKI